MFEKPLGMRDTLPFLYQKKQEARQSLSTVIASWGYRFMDTPILEYYETVGEASAILDQQLFKLIDQQGHTLVLRPDMTTPIARVAASQLKEKSYPLRLAYDGSVFRAQQTEGGKPAQFDQVGIEFIGDDSIHADAEVIALLIESLKASGLKDFQITIGHIGFVNALFDELFENINDRDRFLAYLYRKDYVGYRKEIERLQIASDKKDKLKQLLRVRGSNEVIAQAESLTHAESCQKSLSELMELYKYLVNYEVESYISFDMSLVSHMSYYTGILFEGYAPNLGALLCNGGRYDQLLPSFEEEASATGYAVRLDRLVEALGTINDEKKPIGIIFDDDTFKQAVNQANRLRKEGKQVLIQQVNRIERKELFYEQIGDCFDLTKKGVEESE